MKFVILFAVSIAAVFAAEVPKKGDMRNEFDHLLIETAIHNMGALEHRLIQLTTEIAHLEATKTKAEQEKIVREIEVMVAFVEGAERTFTRELQRKDLNILEQFNFEAALKMSQVLVTDLKQAEVKVKAIKAV